MAFVASIPSVPRASTFTGQSVTRHSQSSSSKRAQGPARRATIRCEREQLKNLDAWVDAIHVSTIEAGTTICAFVAGLDICLACDYDGQVYALGKKGPPTGLPLSGGQIVTDGNVGYVQCPQYGTLFELSTGQLRPDTWITQPPVVSKVLKFLFQEPQGVPVYPIRESKGMLQVLLNVNAKAQYEQKYWKGILDASGKADGGYY